MYFFFFFQFCSIYSFIAMMILVILVFSSCYCNCPVLWLVGGLFCFSFLHLSHSPSLALPIAVWRCGILFEIFLIMWVVYEVLQREWIHIIVGANIIAYIWIRTYSIRCVSVYSCILWSELMHSHGWLLAHSKSKWKSHTHARPTTESKMDGQSWWVSLIYLSAHTHSAVDMF